MKAKKTIGLVLAVCLISALVIAETSTEKEAGQKDKKADISVSRQRSERGPGTAPGRRGTPENRRQAYQERLAKQTAGHKDALAELEAIKKIAEEEKASRTAEAIQKMIDRKDAEFKQKMERGERQRRERFEQIQKRTAGRPVRKKPAEKTEQKNTEEK
ncbi:MAG: hypothetical protein B6I25_01580 [Planctomycetales bacterium 4572_13]|nr:MAG: hypothetical protein B6I25_01580 [Planctomycetales bacterium 4572_13]